MESLTYMLRKKILLHLLVLTISLIGALLTTAIYGKFQHDRYWEVTIYKVQKHQIKLSISMLEFLIDKKSSNAEFLEEAFKDAFKDTKDDNPVQLYIPFI